MAVCSLLRPDDVPEPYRELVTARDRNKAESGSCIIAPGGKVIAAASADEDTIVTATVSLEAVLRCKARLDVGGHYSRPDVLKLLVNGRPMDRVIETMHADSTFRDGAETRTDSAFGAFSSLNDDGTERAGQTQIG